MELLGFEFTSAPPGRSETCYWVDFKEIGPKRDFQPGWSCWLRIHIPIARAARNRREARVLNKLDQNVIFSSHEVAGYEFISPLLGRPKTDEGLYF